MLDVAEVASALPDLADVEYAARRLSDDGLVCRLGNRIRAAWPGLT
jgi:hypothetical protein